MAGVYSQLLSVGGKPARVWRGGTGKPIVLLHGGLGDASTHWRWCWNALADHYAVYAPDLPGFGGMTSALAGASYAQMVDWIFDLLDVLELSQVALAGNSFGAALARLAAAREPGRVTHLLLVNGGHVMAMPGVLRALIKATPLADMIFGTGTSAAGSSKTLAKAVHDKGRLTPEFVAETRRALPGFSATMRQVGLAGAPDARTPQCPVLLVWGAQDQLAPAKSSQQLLRQLPGAALRSIENSGHMPQMEQPDAFVALAREFVQA